MGTSKKLPNDKWQKCSPSESERQTRADQKNGQIPKAVKGQRQKGSDEPSEETLRYLKHFYDPKNLPADFDNWSHREQYEYVTHAFESRLPNFPKSLLYFPSALMRPGDCGEPRSDIPEWLDMEKFKRGQKFARDHLFGLAIYMVLTLMGLYTFKDGMKPIILSGASSSPFGSFRRYRSVIIAITDWFRSDIWTKGTIGNKKIVYTRKQHTNMRKRLETMTNDEVDKATTMANPWCPMRDILLQDFQSSCPVSSNSERFYVLYEDSPSRPKGLNQFDMSLTQFNMMGVFILHPEYFTAHSATDEDLDAYCHLWRGIGYMLGIEDEYNFCAGTLEEVKQRSRDVVEYWIKPNYREITPEWEHVTRCLTEGISYYAYTFPYESATLYFTEILQLPMYHLRSTISYYNWFVYKMLRWTMLYFTRIPYIKNMLNRGTIQLTRKTYKYSAEKKAELRERSDKIMQIPVQ